MKYSKNQYSEGFSVIVLLIAASFLWWGVSSYFPYTLDSWWGLIPLGIGITILLEQIAAGVNRGKLRRIVRFEFEDNPEVTPNEISIKTGLSIKDTIKIRMDLLKQGELLGNNPSVLNYQVFSN